MLPPERVMAVRNDRRLAFPPSSSSQQHDPRKVPTFYIQLKIQIVVLFFLFSLLPLYLN